MRIPIALGLTASLGAALAVWGLASAVESARVEVEVLGRDLLRTNAAVGDAALATEAALRHICRRGNPSLAASAAQQFEPEVTSETKQLSRSRRAGHTEHDTATSVVVAGVDRFGEHWVVETVGGREMATLIMIKNGDAVRRGILTDLVAQLLRNRLADQGAVTDASSLALLLGGR